MIALTCAFLHLNTHNSKDDVISRATIKRLQISIRLKKRKKRKTRAHHRLKVQRQRSSTRSDRKNIQAPLAVSIRTMHDFEAQRQGGRKTGVPGEKPSESDRDGQISAHMRTLGVNPGS